MHLIARLASAAVCSFVLVGCGYAEVAPPRAPVPEMPADVELRTSPPAEGTTRVIVDANGERATVVDVVERQSATAHADGVTAYARGETTKPVCVTPCVVDLTPGMHVLRFSSETDSTRTSEANVQIGDRSKIVRHAIGRSEGGSLANFGASMLFILGLTAAVTGGIMYGMSFAVPKDDGSDIQDPGAAILAAGGGAMLISIPLMLLTRPVYQSGTTTEKSLSAN